MLLKLLVLCSFLASLGSTEAIGGSTFLFIQDVCGKNEQLMEAAQSVFTKYMSLLNSSNSVFLGTNSRAVPNVVLVQTADDLNKAMNRNRAAEAACSAANIEATLDSFYLMIRDTAKSEGVHTHLGKVNIAHVTTLSIDSGIGSYFDQLASESKLSMKFIGITEKNKFFENTRAFNAFPGAFEQTYDIEVALLGLVNAFGSDTKPPIPPPVNIPRCIKNLQLAFAFHTDISSVPSAKDFRDKAQKVFQDVTKYFDIPTVNNIDQDPETCEFNKEQEKNKSLFFGSIYANSSSLLVPTFCYSNMNSYPGTVANANYQQASQVTLQSVIDSYAKFYNSDMKMTCKCFDYLNPDTTKIILWTPLSPTSLDADVSKVNFDGFKLAGFTHIVMPFGFDYKDSPVWRSLVPDQDLWLTDASKANYDVDQIIQDIWTITCRLAGTIEGDQTAEPFNPYTTKKPKTGD